LIAPQPQIPDNLRVYAIGDIHGRLDLLNQLLERIENDVQSCPHPDVLYIFLGDYVDRGPASSGVIDRLIAFGANQHAIYLKGNHEEFLISFFETPHLLQDWSRYGAINTLMSYGLRPPMRPTPEQCTQIAAELYDLMPNAHFNFLQNLYLSLTLGDFFFVHAGVRPQVALEMQSEEDLLWIREEFLSHKERFEKIVVHGHTPVRDPEILDNRINIDTGAFATGRLSCLVLEGGNLRLL